ncbi:MAG: sigma-54-dependent Fis family transcriptional regulator [Deltaproteobacteria bacterium]|nr:sigma-54-dependent Fis family transcriptional regulator [Deltaproteobacteria bacterium]
MPSDTPRILIVDDEINICRNCEKILSKMDCEVSIAQNGQEALALIEAEPFDVVVTDLKMSRMGGMEVLRRVKEKDPDIRVIVMTGYASVSSAVEVMKIGAFDYLPKPFTPHELRAVVLQAITDCMASRQNQRLKNSEESVLPVAHQLIGNSPQIQKVVSMIRKVAPTDATVLVCGESGTGKELVARAVHANSNRKDGVFFAVDCGTLSGNLLASELFGHVKGAFTGAHREKKGIFRLAHQGTVFLDEISNISLDVQGMLLRFLESQEFYPLGGSTLQKVNVRLIFATNQDLQNMAAAGTFRQDFYYRIFVYPILIPPLRDRRPDILPIAYHFLNQFCRRMNKSITGFDDEAGNRLVAFDWPGNVRQLRNVIERSVIHCEKKLISSDDLFLRDHEFAEEVTPESIPQTNEALKLAKKNIRIAAISELEKKFLLNALNQNNWNVTQAARHTGLQRTNFQNLMKKHDIILPRRLRMPAG